MSKSPSQKGVEEARNQLPHLLAAAEKGRSTVITRRGHPIAALVPVGTQDKSSRQQSLLSLAGAGRGLWGKDSSETVHELRDEWDR